jgi:proteic killer suppression protein
MIRSYKDKLTRSIAEGTVKKGFPGQLVRRAQLLLNALDAAAELDDLRFPPGNRLHALEKDRKGQYSLSINMQFRICFRWVDGSAEDVEIVDYH